ncbi:hypothetical protein D3C72_2080390 [compost metagenome]
MDADDEQAWARLRHEQVGVDHQGAIAIPGLGEGSADGFEVLAAMRRQGTADVLDRHHARRAAVGDQAVDQVPEGVEGARPLALQSRPGPGQRQVLTGEGAPHHVGRLRQLGRLQRADVADRQFAAGAPVGLI